MWSEYNRKYKLYSDATKSRTRSKFLISGKQWVFEIYSDMAEIIKGCKTDNNGTVVQGNHKYYRWVYANADDGW